MNLNNSVCKGLQGVCCQTLSTHGEIAQNVATELESDFVMLPRHPSLLEMLEGDTDNKLMYSVGCSMKGCYFSEQEKNGLI